MTPHDNPPLQASRRLHVDALLRQPAGGGARRQRPRRRRDAALRARGPTCRKPPSCCRRPSRRPTTACASSRPAASCPLPAIRRSAAATPGCRPAASRSRPAASCSSARVGLVPIRREGERLAFAAPPLKRSAPSPTLLAKVAARAGPEGAADRRRAAAGQRPRLAGPAAGRRRHRAGAQARPSRAAANSGRRSASPRSASAARLAALIARSNREARAFARTDAGAAPTSRCAPSRRRSASRKTRSPAASTPASRSGSSPTAICPSATSRPKARCLGRDGRVHIERDADGQVWVGGDSVTCIDGTRDALRLAAMKRRRRRPPRRSPRRTLDEGVRWCEATLRRRARPGGAHPLMGTHNRLLKIATAAFPRAYLEIIAIDPRCKPTRAGRPAPLVRPGRRRAAGRRWRAAGRGWSTSSPTCPNAPAAVQRAAPTLRIDRGHVHRGLARHAGRPARLADHRARRWPAPVLWRAADADRMGRRCIRADSMADSGVTLRLACSLHIRASTDLRSALRAIGLRACRCQRGAPNLIATLFDTPRGIVTLESRGI